MSLEKKDKFAKAAIDPRFRKASVSERKVVLDERFSKVLKDKDFSVKASSSRVKGLPSRKTEEAENDQRRFYATAEDAAEEAEFHWSAESSAESEDEKEVAIEEDGEMWSESERSYGEETSAKLAVMHCNWEKITASDLFMMFKTFLKTMSSMSSIVSVSVYLSDFGETELEYERTHGPRLELVKSVSEEELSRMTVDQQQVHNVQLNQAIRKYQKTKLKYYYAIAEFDSHETAELVYSELDGLTASFCAASLDLRFVSEEMQEAIARPPVSVCTKLPESFRPAAFDDGGAAVGLDNTNAKLTWDEDPPERKILRRKFNAKEIMDLELSQYLASDSDDSTQDKDAYRRALLGEEAESASEESEMGDMEMRVNQEVDTLGKKIASGASKKSEDAKETSTWQKYLEKRKDQRKDKKMQRKSQQADKNEERRNYLKGDELQPFVSASKRKTPEMATVESVTQDTRLQKLFDNPDFAIDTTVPQFDKKSSVLKEVIQEKTKRSKKHKASH